MTDSDVIIHLHKQTHNLRDQLVAARAEADELERMMVLYIKDKVWNRKEDIRKLQTLTSFPLIHPDEITELLEDLKDPHSPCQQS